MWLLFVSFKSEAKNPVLFLSHSPRRSPSHKYAARDVPPDEPHLEPLLGGDGEGLLGAEARGGDVATELVKLALAVAGCPT